MVNLSAIGIRLVMMENSIQKAWLDGDISEELMDKLLGCLQECINIGHGLNADGSFSDEKTS